MNFYTKLTLLLFLIYGLLAVESTAQPWTYDFGTTTKSHTSGAVTNFFPSTPSGGGTYRVRVGSAGGNMVLANPGTSLGTGAELQITAPTSTSCNKFTVYGWDNPTTSTHLKFKMRTEATNTASFWLMIGANTGIYTDNNNATFTNALVCINFLYNSTGVLTTQRRDGNGYNATTISQFVEATDQVVEIFANNANTSTTYTKGGVSYTLNAQTWDLWIDDAKVSPANGWAKGAGSSSITSNTTLSAFGFFAESSFGNNGKLYIDDLEYTNSFPTSCTAPTLSPDGFTSLSTAAENSIDLGWTNGNGAGRVIKMNTSNSFTNLFDGVDPTASAAYAGGEQVVYNGTGSSPITITGLLPNTTYYFKGYEYCSPDRVYNNSGSTESVTTDIGNNIILTNTASFGPFCTGLNHTISVGFDSEGTFIEDFKVQISDDNGVFSTNLNDNIIGFGSSSPISALIPSNLPAGNGYRIRVINTDPITIGDDNGSNIVLNATPSTPANTNPTPVCMGNSISVTANGSIGATSYSFWDASTGGNQITTGVTGNTLTLDANTLSGIYTYYIQASSDACNSDRKEVQVEIKATPDLPSGSFNISSIASCSPVSVSFDNGYYFQSSPIGVSLDHPTSEVYMVTSSGKAYVRAYNGNCWSEAIASESIEINQPIEISSQPSNVSIAENGSGTISVIANNVSAYQWQKNDGCGWSNITGATSSSYSIVQPTTDMTGTLYRVSLTGEGVCESLVSESAALTVTAATSITTQNIWSNELTGSALNSNTAITTGHEFNNQYLSNPTISANGITTASYSNRYGGSGWSTSNSVDLNKYIELNINILAGESYNIKELVATLQSSTTGPAKVQIRTNQDGFENSLTIIDHTGTRSQTFPLDLNNVTGNLVIRIYGYNAGANTGTFSINDFDLKGNRVETCTPPTITQQPNAISPCYKTMSVETSSPSATYQWEIKTPSSTQYERILSCTPNTIGGQTSQLEIIGTIPVGTKYRVKVTADNCTAISDSIEYTGNASVSLSNEIGDIILDADPCDANGWTYYSSASNPGQYLFAINWAPSGTISASNQNAKDVAQVMISLNNDFFSNEDVINGDYFATYTMRRYWNVDASSFDEPVNVIFPYLNSEIQEIVDAAQTYASNQVGSRYEGFKWFKIEGQSFEPISSIVTPVNIINSIPLTDVASTSNNITYAQFNGITSFSGGTGATGVGPLINDPLPVELLYFNASCQNSSLTLDWATASEKNADKFIVEGSNDGIAFENIGSVLAYGNSNSLKEYEYKVNEPKHKYYRLLQIDFDGTQEYFKIVSAPCDLSQNMIAARYASNEGIIVEIQSSKNKEMTLTLTSTNGQNILNQKIDVQAGSQRLVLSTEKLPKGIYIISVGNAYQQQTSKLSVY